METHRVLHFTKDHCVIDIATHALKQANASLIPVGFFVHGVFAVAMPCDDVNAILSDWSDDYDSRDLRTAVLP